MWTIAAYWAPHQINEVQNVHVYCKTIPLSRSMTTTSCHVPNNLTLLLQLWQWDILEHPSYSPGMSPCDLDMLPKLKEPLRFICKPHNTTLRHTHQKLINSTSSIVPNGLPTFSKRL
ncbi:hypothetical protein TNCV_2589011 [Trichonephila clavipes]|nr:hypothetical protein TNCV_2589011 [Trichonephila clavipes]